MKEGRRIRALATPVLLHWARGALAGAPGKRMALRSLAEIYARRPKRYTPTRDGRSAGTVPAVPDTDSRSARSTGVVQPPRENEPATAGDQRSQDDASTDSSQGPFRHTDHPLRQVAHHGHVPLGPRSDRPPWSGLHRVQREQRPVPIHRGRRVDRLPTWTAERSTLRRLHLGRQRRG